MNEAYLSSAQTGLSDTILYNNTKQIILQMSHPTLGHHLSILSVQLLCELRLFEKVTKHIGPF